MGVRRPSVRRSVSARTTGRVKRSVSRTVNPLYEKKGMGYVNNPQKAIYNSIYNKTTVGVNPLSDDNSSATYIDEAVYEIEQSKLDFYTSKASQYLYYFFILLCTVLIIENFLIFYWGGFSFFALMFSSILCIYTHIFKKRRMRYAKIKDEAKQAEQRASDNTTVADAKPTVEVKISSELIISPQSEKAMQEFKKYTESSTNPKWHRTQLEKSLSFDFMHKNRDIIDKYEKIMHNDAIAFNKTIDCLTRIDSCKKSIQAFNEFKEYCYQTEGGKIYFQDMWEYCHNSKKECFSVLEQWEEILEYLESNRDNLIDREKRLPTLKNDLIEYFKDRPPILQKNIYADFNPLMKSDIQKIIRELENEKIISRTKKNGTYEITLN